MKTQILQLEAHDDIISTRDKLGWGQTGRVALVWPRRVAGARAPRVLTRRLDLILLQRHSASLGIQIALVTRDPEVRAHARELKIPVFHSVKVAQSVHWRGRRWKDAWRPDPDRRRRHAELLAPRLNAPRLSQATNHKLHPALRWGLFSLAILSLCALAASVLPGAQITLQPETRAQEIHFTLQASPAFLVANLSGEAPARFAEVIVEGRARRPTTGQVRLPEKTATARVRFTNLVSETVSIPAGLVISTVPKPGQPAVRFFTVEASRLPGGVGKTIGVPVRAENPGRSGNVPANTLTAIEGPLGLVLTVTNLLPAGGGSDLPARAPSAEDYEQLSAGLAADLRAAAITDLRSSLAPGDLVITPTLRLVEILHEEFNPPRPEAAEGNAGPRHSPAETLQLSLRLKFEVLVVSGEELHRLSGRILDARLPEGFTPVPDSLQIEFTGLPQVADSASPAEARQPLVQWPVRIRRMIQPRIDPDQEAFSVRGMTARQAAGLLNARLPLESPPKVAISPAWWPRLPLLVTRISFMILE